MVEVRKFTYEDLVLKKIDLLRELQRAKEARPIEDIEWDLNTTEFLLKGFEDAVRE